MPNLFKSAALAAFHQAGGLAAIRWRNRHTLRILMYHRFADSAALASQCAHIRRHYRPVSMAAVSEWLHGGQLLPPGAIAVTVDDGYNDFLEASAVFAEYRIPVTVYLVTDFMDGKSWLWFDRVVYAFDHAQVNEASLAWPGGGVSNFPLDSTAARKSAGRQVADRAVSLSPAARAELVASLPRMLHVEMPEEAPPAYAALSWDAVRSLAASGVEFGAHTKTHPILSAIHNPEELRDEIAGSKARIERELDRPVLHFCYPNGKMQDIGPAAVEAVRAAGMLTAVTAEPGLNGLHSNAFSLNRTGADPGQDAMYFARNVAGWSNPFRPSNNSHRSPAS